MEPKLCECGCGQPTSIIKITDTKRGRIAGEYSRFVHGHSSRVRGVIIDPDEKAPLCACGCGESVTRIQTTNLSKGRIRGEWNRFVRGHASGGTRESTAELPFEVDPDTGCWNWRGSVSRQTGYGMISFAGTNYGVHRLAWQIANGTPLNDRLQIVRHTCDNRRCMNPDHLVLGSHQDNTNDAKERGRMPKGETHANAKLDDQQVRLVREWREQGIPVHDIALRLNVSTTTVRSVIDGETWSHVG